MPALPPTSHASHWPVHALLQHTPSEQIPDPQLLAVDDVQAVPVGSLQAPAAPGTSHLSGAVHDDAVQQTLSTHVKPKLQSDDVTHSDPAVRANSQKVDTVLHL